MTSSDTETDFKPIIIIIIIMLIGWSGVYPNPCSEKNIELWVTTLNNLPAHLFNFARKAFLQVLPTAANLKRGNRTQNPSCPLCASGQVQTNKHVLSNCSCPTALHRNTVQHNAVLSLLIDWLRSNISCRMLIR